MWKIKQFIKKILIFLEKCFIKNNFARNLSQSVCLRRFFDFAEISLLDIGARGGPLREFDFLAPFTRLFICEPDILEISLVEKRLKNEGRWKKVTAIPAAIASLKSKAILHLAKNGGLSSLLEMDIKETNNFYALSGWGNMAKDITVPVMTLDNASKKYGMDKLSVIKLDTQGTELDILKSGSETISSVLVIYIEAEFVPLYKNQPLFGEINSFLERNGFRLFDMQRTSLRRKTKLPLLYSKRELAWAHCLYIREKNTDGLLLSCEQTVKLSVIMAAFRYFDYAVWLLEQKQIQEFLKKSGFENISEELACFADDFWNVFRKQISFFEKKEYLAASATDRKL